jgi:hypothetical protein
MGPQFVREFRKIITAVEAGGRGDSVSWSWRKILHWLSSELKEPGDRSLRKAIG